MSVSKDERSICTMPHLFELPGCPKCQGQVVEIRVGDVTHYERVESKMVPLSGYIGRDSWTAGSIRRIIPFAQWRCVRCGYVVVGGVNYGFAGKEVT